MRDLSPRPPSQASLDPKPTGLMVSLFLLSFKETNFGFSQKQNIYLLLIWLFVADAEYRRQMFDDFSNRDKHDYYFGSYSSFHIHEEMLKDTVRTRTY